MRPSPEAHETIYARRFRAAIATNVAGSIDGLVRFSENEELERQYPADHQCYDDRPAEPSKRRIARGKLVVVQDKLMRHALAYGRSMRSALIIASLAVLSSAPCSAERLFSTPLMDAAVNHDLAKVRKLQANVAPQADANAAGEREQGETGSSGNSAGAAARQLGASPHR
jgi:hypothetical protein